MDWADEEARKIVRIGANWTNTIKRVAAALREEREKSEQCHIAVTLRCLNGPLNPDRGIVTGDFWEALLRRDDRIRDEERAARNDWQPIETAPKDGEFLAVWCGVNLDEDGDLTDERNGQTLVGVARRLQSCWDEPEALNAIGEYFGNDWEWEEEPTCWMPLPKPPDAARKSEPLPQGGKS